MSKASGFQAEEDTEDWDFAAIDALIDAEKRRKEALQVSRENACPGSSAAAQKADRSSVQAPPDTSRVTMTRRSSSQARRSSSAMKASRKQQDLATRYGSLHPPQSQESNRSVAATPLREAPSARSSRAAPLYPTPSRRGPETEPEGPPSSVAQAGGPASVMVDEEMHTPARDRRQSVSPVGVLGFNGMPNRKTNLMGQSLRLHGRPDSMNADEPTAGRKGSEWATDAHEVLDDNPAPTEPAPYLSQDPRTSAPGSFFCAEHDQEMEVDGGPLLHDHPEQGRAGDGRCGEPPRAPAGKQGTLGGEGPSSALHLTTQQATASSFTPEGRSQLQRPPTQNMPSMGSHPVSQWRSTRDSSAAEARPAPAFPVPRFVEPQQREPVHSAAEHSGGGNGRQAVEEAKQREKGSHAQASQAVPQVGPQEPQLQQSEAGISCNAHMGPARDVEAGRCASMPAVQLQHNAEDLHSAPLHCMNQSLRQAWGARLLGQEAMPDLAASGGALGFHGDAHSTGLELSGSPVVYRLWMRCPDSLITFLGDATGGPWEQADRYSVLAGHGRGHMARAGAVQSVARTGVSSWQDSVAMQHPNKRTCKAPEEPGHTHHQLCAQVRETLFKVWHHQLPPQALLESLLGAVDESLRQNKSGDLKGQPVLCSALDVVHHLVQLSPGCCTELCMGAEAVNARVCGAPQSCEDGQRHGPAPGTCWPSTGDKWEIVHSAGHDTGGNDATGVESAAAERPGVRTVKKGRVVLTLQGTEAGQGPQPRPQAGGEGSVDAAAGCQARLWWVLLSAGCGSEVPWEARALALGTIFVTIASTDPVQQRAVFAHLLTRRVVTALLGRGQPAALRHKALSMAQLLAACPSLLPHLLHTSLGPLPSLEGFVDAAAGAPSAQAAGEQDEGQDAPGGAAQGAGVQPESSAKLPKHSALSQLISCVADANLVLALEALRVLCQLSSLYGPWVLLTCSSSAAHLPSKPGRTRGARASDQSGNEGAAECRPASHAMHEILAATEKCLGVVYRLGAEGVPGQAGGALGDAKLPWAVLVLALKCIAQVFPAEPLPVGEVPVVREHCPVVVGAAWPPCWTDYTQLAKAALVQASQVVQCGAASGVSEGSEDMKHAQALVKRLLSQCPG